MYEPEKMPAPSEGSKLSAGSGALIECYFFHFTTLCR